MRAPSPSNTTVEDPSEGAVDVTNLGQADVLVWGTTGVEIVILDKHGAIVSAPSTLAIVTSIEVPHGKTRQVRARLPRQLCQPGTGLLDPGTYTVVPVALAATKGGPPVLVKGSSSQLTVE